MLVENIPEKHLARDKDQDMSTLDVSPTMRAQTKGISKSHGRGVALRHDGVARGTFIPISILSFMFKNQSIVDDNDEFGYLAYRTIPPFRHDMYTPSAPKGAMPKTAKNMPQWLNLMLPCISCMSWTAG